MLLKPKGYHAEMFERSQKERLANDFILGLKDVGDYIKGVCYDAVAYVVYLQNPRFISLRELENKKGKDWESKFSCKREWTGSPIAPGTVIFFYRPIDGGFFHAALAVGGRSIRSVNGGTLGAGWTREVNLLSVLNSKNEDGTYNYDGAKIRVYLMSF